MAQPEPIAVGDSEAARRLHGVADVLLVHDRPTAARYDASVVVASGWVCRNPDE